MVAPQLERDISHITHRLHEQHPACRRKSSLHQRRQRGAALGGPGAPVVSNRVLQEDQVQELQVDCGFHVVLNARSLTKSMPDRDGGPAVVANF
jgi:hypothetical protein